MEIVLKHDYEMKITVPGILYVYCDYMNEWVLKKDIIMYSWPIPNFKRIKYGR